MNRTASDDIKPIKVDDCFKLVLHSQNATMRTDNSFNFNVNLKEIEGDIVRCAVKKVRYPAPATYIPRRLWFADGNTFFPSYTTGQVNDYTTVFNKYGINTWVYFYIPSRNVYARLIWNNITSSIVRQTFFSSSVDGVNWTSTGYASTNNIPYSGGGSAPTDCYEIDITTQPVGTKLQNIHCPELKPSMSYDTTTKDITNIIGNICPCQNFNPYVVNDYTYQIKDEEVCNELSASYVRGITNLNIFFSRVATPYVKEPVVMPWLLEIDFFSVQ